MRGSRSDHIKGDLIGITTNNVPNSLKKSFKKIAAKVEYHQKSVLLKKSKNEKAIEMFVQEELMERLLQLHRHSYIPYRLAKFREEELRKKPRAVRNLYLKEVKRVVKANRNFID